MYTLFLDDERFPFPNTECVVIARNFDQAVKVINDLGIPTKISFDHDLGNDSQSGKEFLDWLIYWHLEYAHNLATIQEVIVHSANPIGARNIKGLWDNFADVYQFGVIAELRPRLT
jgi:hypothetical protein